VLPILVDLQAGTLEPAFAAIPKSPLPVRRARDRGDRPQPVAGRAGQRLLWILPFWPTPERRANAVCARELTAGLRADAADPQW